MRKLMMETTHHCDLTQDIRGINSTIRAYDTTSVLTRGEIEPIFIPLTQLSFPTSYEQVGRRLSHWANYGTVNVLLQV